ncbi:hypothetical protein T4B_2911 [Trichinella pseudospiralis]|uniref:Uncharacterized protein n=1 Tax=Trichinella pseudospiralis TaxID=6337 RepID=A0A0V1IP72_TRIPS|nr:hypothetical protein T4B_2911 [Trichinella pseudospiralis]
MFISGAHLRQRKSLEQKKGKAFFTCSLHNSFKTPLIYLPLSGWMQLARCVLLLDVLFINEILTKSLCLSMFTRLPQDLLVV